MYSKGQVVYSKSGRDKRRPFIVIDFNEQYLYLVDGDLRKLEKPKKKKKMHVQIVNNVIDDIKQKLENGGYLNDADFRKALQEYKL
ncbi:MAG: RNA-binding protein [Clostridiales bacterium]|nr:RNA-binding protein [Clostridiales bacterium]